MRFLVKIGLCVAATTAFSNSALACFCVPQHHHHYAHQTHIHIHTASSHHVVHVAGYGHHVLVHYASMEGPYPAYYHHHYMAAPRGWWVWHWAHHDDDDDDDD